MVQDNDSFEAEESRRETDPAAARPEAPFDEGLDADFGLRELKLEFAGRLAGEISGLSEAVRAWQESAGDRQRIREAIRQAHTLRGAAGSFGAERLSQSVAYLEGILQGLSFQQTNTADAALGQVVRSALTQAARAAEEFAASIADAGRCAAGPGTGLEDQALAPAPGAGGGRQRIRALFIEDSEIYGRMIRRSLIRDPDLEFEVRQVDSLSAASDCLRAGAYDVVLLDMELPDSSGLDTFAAVQRAAGDIPVVILTAHDDHELALEAVQRGAGDYLIKQRVTEEALHRCIRYAMERKKAEIANLRLTAVGDFLSTLAHDLRGPMLGAGRIFDILLASKVGSLTKSQEELVVRLQENNQELLRLVERLIDVYRFETHPAQLKVEPVALAPVVGAIVDQLRQAMEERDLTLAVSLPGDLPAISGDRLAIDRLLVHLIDNAIKFSRAGTTIEIGARAHDQMVTVRVTSRGEFIDPGIRALMFKQLWQGVPGQKYVANTGLGLYLCKRIVDAHRGSISCESTTDGVTTFTVILPAGTAV